MGSLKRAAVLFGLAPFFIWGQSFDVASVKRLPDTTLPGKISRTGGSLTMRGVTLGWAIRWAYGLQEYQLSGPDWLQWHPRIARPRFDLMAKSAGSSSSAEMRLMLQKLLAERFDLQLHFEQRTFSAVVIMPGERWAMTFLDSADDQPVFSYPSRREYRIHNATMAEVCEALSSSLQTAFVDLSNLGDTRFDVTMRLPELKTTDEWLAALIDSLRKDLGASVHSRKMPLKVLVVDSALQTPTAN